MFDTAAVVDDAEQAVNTLAVGLDPDLVTASTAMALVARIDRMERQLSGVKTLLAGRVADSQVWKHRGDRSAAHWLAGQAGTSVGDAVNTLETAARLKDLPVTAAAVRDGILSKAQAAAVTDAATVAPDAETALIGLAGRESLKALREEGARRKHAHLDEQARYEAIRASRHVRFGTDPDGAATMGLRTTPDALAEIKAAIAHHQTTIFDRARRAGRRDPFEAYAADGLLQMARASLGHPDTIPKRVPTKVIVRVDHTALTRGQVTADEICDIPGTGPIPVAQVQHLLTTGDAFTAIIGTDHTGQPATVAHHGHRPITNPAALIDTLTNHGHDVTTTRTTRTPDAYQRTALDWTNTTCTVQRCDLPRQEIDHRVDWAHQHRTRLDELDGLCRHHHALKTRHNYHLAPGTGRRPLLAPTGTDPP